MFARSTVWSGDEEARARLLAALAEDVAPGCREIPGHGWITAVQMDGDTAVSVTSFWQDAADVAPDGVGTRRLAALEASGCRLVKSSRYDVRFVHRVAPTVPGFLVSAAAFPYDPDREQQALDWATRMGRMAASLPGYAYGVVELAEEPRVISVTTWRDRGAFAAVEADLLQGYGQAPAAVDAAGREWNRGPVVFSSS